MAERILLVDDEVNVVLSMQRQLRNHFEVITANSGAEALSALESQGPFAVIVSDMRMPHMDGIELLTKVMECSPDTVRIMLTGNADQDTAIEAVNTGQVFKFLTKPCSTADLMTSLELAVQQYNLIIAEKELLNETLKGSITVMAELLSLANATAFSSGYRIRPAVRHIAKGLGVPDVWQYEVAALMSQIGCITLPGDVLNKLHAGISLLDDEQQMYENHPEIGRKLICQIPRLEKVAQMIACQLRSTDSLDEDSSLDEAVVTGAQILKAAIDYDMLRQQEYEHSKAIKLMRKRSGRYNPEILALLEKHRAKGVNTTVQNLSLKDVIPGMIANGDVLAKNGTLLIPRGQEITWNLIKSLWNFEKHIGIMEPICVLVTAPKEQEPLSLDA